MLKRLIEVALPLKEVSEQSAREKRQLSALHLWWARRPLPVCRMAVFASLIPDPDDPACPNDFRLLVTEALKHDRFRPNSEIGGKKVEDTPRNRCLEFIKELVKWENSHKSEFIEPARKLIAAAHRFLHPGSDGDWPTVLDPFAGGAAIPLEAMRLGCEIHAVDINPIAHLIELCTLIYPQKYGQPQSRALPTYVKRLIIHNRAENRAAGDSTLFDQEDGEHSPVDGDASIPDVEISEAEYVKNPLATDVKYWGHRILSSLRSSIGHLYENASSSHAVVCYWWAKTITCPNPMCRAQVPLLKSMWLSKRPRTQAALRMTMDPKNGRCSFDVVESSSIDFDADAGTIQRGSACCPFCTTIIAGEALRSECNAGRLGQQLIAVIENDIRRKRKVYRAATERDVLLYGEAVKAFEELRHAEGPQVIPQELIPPDRPAPNSRGLSAVVRYGFQRFGDLFNPRQLVALTGIVRSVRKVAEELQEFHDKEYATAVAAYLAILVDKHADYNSILQWWHASNEQMAHTFSRQALSMVWDYCEVNPFNGTSGGLNSALNDILSFPALKQPISGKALVTQGSATRLGLADGVMSAVVTDPPYYDSVPYSDLSDYFYVWIKRILVHRESLAHSFRSPVTPKKEELIAYYGAGKRAVQKTPAWYEQEMRKAFAEIHRVLQPNGVSAVMFAHRTTSAWEALIAGLLQAGLTVVASWPIHTEMMTRMVARNTAALASSVTLVCRRRPIGSGGGLWDDVRRELQQIARERLDFFWSQGIRGADFFISAIGPGLSVFGKYERVTKLSGEEVTVGQFLDEVRGLVTNYALAKILKTTHTANIDPESRFYVVWKWSYAEAKVPADESFKLAQALGMDTAIMWDRTGILEKAGENVLAVPIAKRMKIKDLGEPNADSSPASLIDVLHRMCVFRDKGDTDGMAEFLARSGQGKNPALWLVGQAVSEILADGDKEKQLMQGLLNQRDKLAEGTGLLF